MCGRYDTANISFNVTLQSYLQLNGWSLVHLDYAWCQLLDCLIRSANERLVTVAALGSQELPGKIRRLP